MANVFARRHSFPLPAASQAERRSSKSRHKSHPFRLFQQDRKKKSQNPIFTDLMSYESIPLPFNNVLRFSSVVFLLVSYREALSTSYFFDDMILVLLVNSPNRLMFFLTSRFDYGFLCIVHVSIEVVEIYLGVHSYLHRSLTWVCFKKMNLRLVKFEQDQLQCR